MRAAVILAALTLSVPIARPLFAQVSADDAPPPGADPAAVARQRYNAGSQAFQARRFVEAALHFEAASAAVPSAIALFTAALAWEQANTPDRAADDYGRALALPNLPADKATNAKERLAALEAVLGRLDVTAPDGYRVQLDALTEVATPAVLHGTAGVHSLSVRAPDKSIDHRQVTLQIGQATKLDLSQPPPDAKKEPEKPPAPVVTAPPPAPAPPPPEESTGVKVRRAAGFIALGFGGAALFSGVVLGLQANDARDAYVAHPSQQAYDHASSLQTWTNMVFIGGGVFAVGGAVLVLWPSPRPASAPAKEPEKEEQSAPAARLVIAPTLGGATLRGSF